MAVATASATSDVKNEKTSKGIAIESKEKKISSYKVTWNYNGGKIGSKKTKVTTVKKGSKIGKLAATPKRNEYSFKGWFTKKSGGKKISKNTKPSKSVTYFAQWTKGSTSTSSKLVGHLQYKSFRSDLLSLPVSFRTLAEKYDYYDYYLHKNGTFNYFFRSNVYSSSFNRDISVQTMTEGKYKVANGKIYFTNILYERGYPLEARYKDTVFEYKLGKDTGGEYLFIPYFRYDESYVDIKFGVKFRIF